MWVWLKNDHGMWLNLDKVDCICQSINVWKVNFSKGGNMLVSTPPNEFELAKVAPCVTPE